MLLWRSVCLLRFIEAAYSSGTQCTFVLPFFTRYVQPLSFRQEKRAIMLISCLLHNALKPIKKERQSKAVFFFPPLAVLNQQSHWWHRYVFTILSSLHPESPSTVYSLPFVLGWWELMVLWFAPANKGLMFVSREVTRMAARVVRDWVWHCDRMCAERLCCIYAGHWHALRIQHLFYKVNGFCKSLCL